MRKTYLQSGLSLLELLVAISIAAILMTAAVPSMQTYTTKSQVKSLHREIEGAVNFARSQAVSKGRRVALCGKAAGAEACSGGTADWVNGWLVFVDSDSDGDFNTGDQLLQVNEYTGRHVLSVFEVLADGSLNNNINSVTWNSRGYMADGSRAFLRVCDADGANRYAKGLMIARSGRVLRTADETDSGVDDYIFDGGARTDISC